MDRTSVLLLVLLGTAIALLVVASVIGIHLWRGRRETARRKSLASTF